MKPNKNIAIVGIAFLSGLLLFLALLGLSKNNYLGEIFQRLGVRTHPSGQEPLVQGNENELFQMGAVSSPNIHSERRFPAKQLDIDDNNTDLNLDEQLQYALAGGALAPHQREEFIREFQSAQVMAREKRSLEETEVLEEY